MLISLGLALGGYELAVTIGVSGPIMAVVAGLFIGDVGKQYGMGAVTQEYLDKFWEIIDEVLNAVLFLLIGVEVFALSLDLDMILAGVLAIGLSLLARLVAIAVPGAPPAPGTAAGAGRHPDHDLGWPEGGDSGGPGPFSAGKRVEADDPGGDLFRGGLLDHRSGPDSGAAGALVEANDLTDRPFQGSGRSVAGALRVTPPDG